MEPCVRFPRVKGSTATVPSAFRCRLATSPFAAGKNGLCHRCSCCPCEESREGVRLHSNQSSTCWQAKNCDTRNNAPLLKAISPGWQRAGNVALIALTLSGSPQEIPPSCSKRLSRPPRDSRLGCWGSRRHVRHRDKWLHRSSCQAVSSAARTCERHPG